MIELDSPVVLAWLCAMVLFFGSLAFIFITGWLESRREKAVLKALQNMQVESGKTLQESVRDNFDEDGDWLVQAHWVSLFVAGGALEFLFLREKKGWSFPEVRIPLHHFTWAEKNIEWLKEELLTEEKRGRMGRKRTAPDPKRRDITYRVLHGFLETDDLKPTQAMMQIQFLTEVIYQHRVNLCERTGLELEDEDLEAIVTTYEKLNRLSGEVMYNQGWLSGSRTEEIYVL